MDGFEERSRALFQDSVNGLDMAIRSRLTQARHAALGAPTSNRRSWLFRPRRPRHWMPMAGVTAAAVLGAALWLGSPLGNHGLTSADTLSNLEDLEIVAASEGASGDAMEMLQDDIDFYDFADTAANSEPTA
jgi:hypothetical protein